MRSQEGKSSRDQRPGRWEGCWVWWRVPEQTMTPSSWCWSFLCTEYQFSFCCFVPKIHRKHFKSGLTTTIKPRHHVSPLFYTVSTVYSDVHILHFLQKCFFLEQFIQVFFYLMRTIVWQPTRTRTHTHSHRDTHTHTHTHTHTQSQPLTATTRWH